MHAAQLGDRVRVQYFRIFTQGTRPPQLRGRKTREFIVGGSEVTPTLSLGVVGMSPGERKQLTLPVREAYGPVRPKLIRQVPRTRLPPNLELRVGQRLQAVHPLSGRRQRVRILEIQPHSVLVNGNHPLAGKEVEVEVRLISLLASSAEGPLQGGPR